MTSATALIPVSRRRRITPAAGQRTLAWGMRVVFVAVLLLIWQLASQAPTLVHSLPGPLEVVRALVSQLADPLVWADLWFTIRSATVGLAISMAGGTIIGLLIGSSRFLYRSTTFSIDFLRTVPGLAVVPLGILVFGPTMSLDVFMIVFSAIWPVMIQSIAAVRNLDAAVIELAAVYRISRPRTLLQVLLPACLPAVAAGFRVAAVLSLLLAIGTELLTGSPGLGSRIALYQETGNYPPMYACVVVAALLGVLFNGLVRTTERRLLRWYHVPRELARKG